MKAIVLDGFGGPEVLKPGDVEAPTAGPGRVLIRVHATSVNRPDVIQRQGHYPPPPGESPILGLEAAGTVEALGAGVTGFARGERVLALLGGGGYAELAVAHAGHVMRIPPSLSFEQAACICETYLTAYMNLFLYARLADGETVLLHGGGGGVATAAMQIVKALAPRARMLVTASTGKVERVKRSAPTSSSTTRRRTSPTRCSATRRSAASTSSSITWAARTSSRTCARSPSAGDSP